MDLQQVVKSRLLSARFASQLRETKKAFLKEGMHHLS